VNLPLGISLGVLDLQLTHATAPSTATHGTANAQDQLIVRRYNALPECFVAQ
jgi:hypothetical protein